MIKKNKQFLVSIYFKIIGMDLKFDCNDYKIDKIINSIRLEEKQNNEESKEYDYKS